MGAGWALAGYDVLELVGFGGSGEVWRGRHLASGDAVALKRLRTADAVARERLRREAAVLSSVAGDHVVRVRDVVVTAEEAVLVMDYAAGGSLAAVLSARSRLAAPEVVTLVAPLAMALADAHDRGLVHADVTPANIVFTADGRPLLTDFGVARAVGSVDAVVEGTPDYLAPEVLAGEPVGPAADVYALCTVAAQALARAAAPHALVEAIDSGLAADPYDRPDARQLASAVLHACAAAPVGLVRSAAPPPAVVTHPVRVRDAAPTPAPAERATVRRRSAGGRRRLRRRRRLALPRRLLVGGVAAVALVLAAAGGVLWGHRVQSSAAVLPRAHAAAETAAGPVTVPVAEPVSWTQTVSALERLRAEAVTTDHPALLDLVYTPGRLLTADRGLLLRLRRERVHAVGFAITTVRAEPVLVAAASVTLRVTDAMSAYAIVGADGHVVAHRAETPPRTFTMVLVRAGVGWRISSIHP